MRVENNALWCFAQAVPNSGQQWDGESPPPKLKIVNNSRQRKSMWSQGKEESKPQPEKEKPPL